MNQMNELQIAIDLLQLFINNYENGDTLVIESELKNFCLNKYNSKPSTEEISNSIELINSSANSKIITEGWHQSGGFLGMLSTAKESKYTTVHSLNRLNSLLEIFIKKNEPVKPESNISEFEELSKFQERWDKMALSEKQEIARESDRLNNIGANFYNQDNLEDAIKYFNMAIEVMPTNNDSLKNLVICYKYLGEFQKMEPIKRILNHLGY
jgi:tetratricopeptide (TPR) repeat protein